MPIARENDPELIAAYRDAAARLPVLTRVVFSLHRVDDLPYSEIARRLSIDYVAVVACISEALGMIAAILDGGQPRRWQAAQITPAEQALHERFRVYCEDSLRRLGIGSPIVWKKIEDDDVAVMTAMLRSMPKHVQGVAGAYFGDRMTVAQVAAQTGLIPWIVRHRLHRLIEITHRGPETFEEWLRKCGSDLRLK